MSAFDSAKLRESVLSDTSVRKLLPICIPMAKDKGSLGSLARSCLRSAVEAILVGLNGEAESLLNHSAELAETAIATPNIPPAQHFHPAHYFSILALSRWLLTDDFDATLFDRAADEALHYLKNVRGRTDTAFSLPLLLPTGRLQEVVNIAEARGLAVTGPANRIKSPGKMSSVRGSGFDWLTRTLGVAEGYRRLPALPDSSMHNDRNKWPGTTRRHPPLYVALSSPFRRGCIAAIRGGAQRS